MSLINKTENSRRTFSNMLTVMTMEWMIHRIIYECFKSVVLK
jgi:hypothetical protein